MTGDDAAARRAAEAFGLTLTGLEMVSLSENITYRVWDGDHSYVLRLHRPGYHSLPELESERVWLSALRDSGIAVPQRLRAPDGRHYVPVPMSTSHETRYAGLAAWADGEVLGEVGDLAPGESVSGHFFQLGSIMARMHNQASGWVPPPGYTRQRLDVDGLLGEAPFWGRFWEHPDLTPDQAEVLLDGRDHLRRLLTDYGTNSSTFSMIHADLHLANLLVNGDAISVIDFDDAGFGWHQYDIAVAFFHSRHVDDFDSAAEAFLEGYRRHRTISDDDLRLVPVFELVRAMAIIGWKAQRPEVDLPAGFFDAVVNQAVGGCQMARSFRL